MICRSECLKTRSPLPGKPGGGPPEGNGPRMGCGDKKGVRLSKVEAVRRKQTLSFPSASGHNQAMRDLSQHRELIVRQRRELFELVGFETRNKYEIHDERGELIGFCAEQQKNLFGMVMRHFFGHWRRFDLHFFDEQRREVLLATHPFRFFFQCLEVRSPEGVLIGVLQQRFGILRKKFDLFDSQGRRLMRMRSGFFQFWTFPFFRGVTEVAVIRKKWSGFLKEAFLDADNFQIHFSGGSTLGETERALILAAGIFIDLQYFERKASSR